VLLGTVSSASPANAVTYYGGSGYAPTAVAILHNTASTGYDLAGDTTSTADALGNTSAASYDILGQVTTVTQPSVVVGGADVSPVTQGKKGVRTIYLLTGRGHRVRMPACQDLYAP
jgi:YD repeat-containing protein